MTSQLTGFQSLTSQSFRPMPRKTQAGIWCSSRSATQDTTDTIAVATSSLNLGVEFGDAGALLWSPPTQLPHLKGPPDSLNRD